MENNWQKELASILRNEIQLTEVSEHLKSLRAAGIPQEEIREYLNTMRTTSGEVMQDRILEVLDVVEGYCNPQYRVW